MNFKIILLYITFSLFFLSCGTNSNNRNNGNIIITFNPSEQQSKISRIAIFPFNTRFAVLHEYQGQAFADHYTKLFQSIEYNCIDREIISITMKEQSLDPNGPVDLNTAIKIAGLLGAEGIIQGDIERRLTFISDWWHYEIKLVNAGTGQFVWSIDAADVSSSHIIERLKNELDNGNK